MAATTFQKASVNLPPNKHCINECEYHRKISLMNYIKKLIIRTIKNSARRRIRLGIVAKTMWILLRYWNKKCNCHDKNAIRANNTSVEIVF